MGVTVIVLYFIQPILGWYGFGYHLVENYKTMKPGGTSVITLNKASCLTLCVLRIAQIVLFVVLRYLLYK